MEISILTLFPEMFKGPFTSSIIKRAIEKKLVKISYRNIRDFGIGKHKVVDDKPYGGGSGMIIRVDVLERAIENTKNKNLKRKEEKVILLDPSGKTFNQRKAKSLSKLKHLVLVCGHYEGVDIRIDEFVDEKISIGDFIVTGGEIPAMLITDSVVRLLKGAIKEKSVRLESFSPYPLGKAYLEYPQYTKPRTYKEHQVPKILLSGNHQEIERWRNEQRVKKTYKYRPDLVRNLKALR